MAHNLPQLHHVARVIEVCTLPSEFLISTSELGGGEDATKTDLRRNNIYIYIILHTDSNTGLLELKQTGLIDRVVETLGLDD